MAEMEVDPQIHDETIDQSQPLPGQVPNPAQGYCYQITDIERVKRFLCLGTELGCYRASQQHRRFSRSHVRAIDRLLQDGKGRDVVKLIKDISVDGRACKQGPAIYALAVCARSNCPSTKHAAYDVLGDVCRIPTHLFQFIKFCEDINGGSTGWGRAHRRAINKWYENFARNDGHRDPLKLAYLVTKFNSRYGFSHRDIIRLAHVRSRNRSIRIILQHALRKPKEIADSDQATQVTEFLNAVKEAKKCRVQQDEEKLKRLIAEYQLSWEHVPTQFLKSNLNVWKVLYRLMPLEAMIRHLGKFSELGFHDVVGRKDFWVSLVEDKLKDDILLSNARIHPFRLLVALKQYNLGKSQNGKLQWRANERVSRALEGAFYRLTEMLPPNERRYLIAISTGEDMQKMICGSSIRASEAAAAIVLSTAKSANVETILFKDSILDACTERIDRNDDLNSIEEKIFRIPRQTGTQYQRQDLSVPFRWATARKERFDAIIVLTDSLTSCGGIHPAEAIKQYSQFLAVPNYRMVVVSLTANKYTIAPPDDTNTLDVVGFDAHAPAIIMKFIEGFEQMQYENVEIDLHADY